MWCLGLGNTAKYSHRNIFQPFKCSPIIDLINILNDTNNTKQPYFINSFTDKTDIAYLVLHILTYEQPVHNCTSHKSHSNGNQTLLIEQYVADSLKRADSQDSIIQESDYTDRTIHFFALQIWQQSSKWPNISGLIRLNELYKSIIFNIAQLYIANRILLNIQYIAQSYLKYIIISEHVIIVSDDILTGFFCRLLGLLCFGIQLEI